MSRLTEMRDQYANLLLQGMKQHDAYLVIYPTRAKWQKASIDNKASALARHPAVVAKMQASREVVTKKVQEVMQYGITEAMDEAMQAFSMAIEVRAPAAMVAAAQLRAKLQGLLVDKKEIAVTQMASMTPTDKQLLLDAANQALAERKALLAPDQPITDIEPKLSSN